MTYKTLLNLFVLTFITITTKSQGRETISLDETIKFINSRLDNQITFDLRNGDIIIKFYDEKNRHFRTDKADTEHLDWRGIRFAEEDQLFVLPCYEADGKCVERKFHLKKEGGDFARTSFKLKSPDDFEPLKKAITHLLRTVEEFDYKNNEPFDK